MSVFEEQIISNVIRQLDEYKKSLSKTFKVNIDEILEIKVERVKKEPVKEVVNPVVKQVAQRVVNEPKPEPEEEYEEEYEEAEEEYEEPEEEIEPEPEPIPVKRNNNMRNIGGSAMAQLRAKPTERAPPAPARGIKTVQKKEVKQVAKPVKQVVEKVYRGEMSEYRHKFRAMNREQYKKEIQEDGLAYKLGIYETLVGMYWRGLNGEMKKRLVIENKPISLREYWNKITEKERQDVRDKYPGSELYLWK